MEDHETYYTHPKEMVGVSKAKQNYAMHRQLSFFEEEVERAEGLFSLDRFFRKLRDAVPRNCSVDSLDSLRQQVVETNDGNSPQQRASKAFFEIFFEYIDRLRILNKTFKERIHAVLYKYFFDPAFMQLRDLHMKKGSPSKKGPGGISPDLVEEVGELCWQVCYSIDRLDNTVEEWLLLLRESEIDHSLFDDKSAYSVRKFKDCARFQNVLRLTPDVLVKIRRSAELAKDWWYASEMIRRKLAGHQAPDSGLSSSSEMEASSATPQSSRPEANKRQKTIKDHPITQKPTVFRKKAKKPEDNTYVMGETADPYSPEPPSSQRVSGETTRRPKVKPSNQPWDKKRHDLVPDEMSEYEKQQDNSRSHHKRQSKKPKVRSKATQTEFEEDEQFEEDEEIEDIEESQQSDKAQQTEQYAQSEEEEEEEEEYEEPAPIRKTELKMHKQPKRGRPTADNSRDAGALKRERGQQTRDHRMDKKISPLQEEKTDEKINKATEAPKLKSTQKDKHQRGQGGKNKNRRSNHPQKDAGDKPPTVRKDGRGKGRPNDQTGSAEDAMEALSLEQDVKSKDDESTGQSPISWQDKKLELHQRVEGLIRAKGVQRAGLKLLTAMADNLAKEIARYRGSYHIKRKLQARVALLSDKAKGWKEETRLLDNQLQDLEEDLAEEIQINGSLYRYGDIMRQDRLAHLNDLVREETVRIMDLEEDLEVMSNAADKLAHYGNPSDTDLELEEFEAEFGSRAGRRVRKSYENLSGNLRPYRSLQTLRDEELLMGRSLRNKYERSIWDGLKRESCDSTSSAVSLDDSVIVSSRAPPPPAKKSDGTRGGNKGRKKPRKGYVKDNFSSSDEE